MRDLESMTWEELLQLRRQAQADQQASIAPYEHRAWAREYVSENPMSAPVVALMVPGYQAWKAVRGGARTKPSIEQMRQGWLGTWEGLQRALRGENQQRNALMAMIDRSY